MKCKKHPTVLWEFFTAKSEHVHIDVRTSPQHSTHGSLHITTMQSGGNPDRIAIEQQNNQS